MNMVAPTISTGKLGGTNIHRRGSIPASPTMAPVQAPDLKNRGETIFAC